MVRSHLEYCIQVWCPFLNKYNIIYNIKALEWVQSRVAYIINGCQILNYEERLKHHEWTTLKKRVIGDWIETYKTLTNKVEVPSERLLL